MILAIRTYFRRTGLTGNLLFLIVLIQVVWFSWSINRGFDFTDEAYSYTGFKNQDQLMGAHTYYTVIYNALFGGLGISIVKVRIIRLLLLLAGGVVFGAGLVYWFRRKAEVNFSEQLTLFMFVLCGSLLINANGSQSLTYNLSSTIFLQFAVAVFLFSQSGEKAISKIQAARHVLLGALLFLLFAVKMSTAITLFLIMLPVIAIDKKNFKMTGVYLACIVIGFLLTWILIFQSDAVRWFTEYRKSIELLIRIRSSGVNYLGDLQYVSNSIILRNILFVVIAIASLIGTTFLSNKIIRILLATIGCGWLAYLSYTENYYTGGIPAYYYFTLLYFLVLFILFFSRAINTVVDVVKKRANLEIPLVIGFLLCVPLCGMLGSQNYLFIQIIWYMSFVFAAIFLMAFYYGTALINCLVVVLAVNGACQAISGIVYNPYRTNPLAQESESVAGVFSQESVLVRSEIKQSLESAHHLLYSKTDFVPGDPIFAFASDLGFVYFLQGTLPGWTYYAEEPSEWNTYRFCRSNLQHPDRTIFILPANYQMHASYLACLKELGIRFPENYTLLGQIQFHNEGVDRPLNLYVASDRVK